jgi:hypothetical protein
MYGKDNEIAYLRFCSAKGVEVNIVFCFLFRGTISMIPDSTLQNCTLIVKTSPKSRLSRYIL